jgi:hypothetical protein
MTGISNLEEYFRVNVEKKIFMYDYHPIVISTHCNLLTAFPFDSTLLKRDKYWPTPISSKVPEQEDHDLTPATRLLEKRREMLEVENGLNQQKEEFAMKMESLTQRRDELARKESQLKDSLLKFDKFLKVSTYLSCLI